jgi:hypothetical protein
MIHKMVERSFHHFFIYVNAQDALPGVVTYANNPLDPAKFVANGQIEEAYGPFASWQGRRVHIRGDVYWIAVGVPERAEGTFRIN